MFSPAHFFMRIGLLAMLTSPASAAARTDLYGDALPPGAVARLGSVRFRFAPSICSLAFSPDGKRLAGGDSHHLFIWDVATGKRIREFKFDSVNIWLVGFDSKGKVVAVGIDHSIRASDMMFHEVVLLRPEMAKEPIRLPMMETHIWHLTLSPDGERLFLVTIFGIDVWDFAAKERTVDQK